MFEPLQAVGTKSAMCAVRKHELASPSATMSSTTYPTEVQSSSVCCCEGFLFHLAGWLAGALLYESKYHRRASL